jgi:hypothetical protein
MSRYEMIIIANKIMLAIPEYKSLFDTLINERIKRIAAIEITILAAYL